MIEAFTKFYYWLREYDIEHDVSIVILAKDQAIAKKLTAMIRDEGNKSLLFKSRELPREITVCGIKIQVQTK